MDPITISMIYATVVALIGLFKQLKDGRNKTNLKDFTEWLEEHKFHDIIPLITENNEISSAIQNLLKENHEEITKKLSDMDRLLATILTKVDGLHQLSRAIYPDAGLSDQAIKILRNAVYSEKGGFSFRPMNFQNQKIYYVNFGPEEINDWDEFFEADLNTLKECGFIFQDNEKPKVYYLTREAQTYINSISEEK